MSGEQKAAPLGEIVEGGLRRDPVGPVGLGVVAVGPLPLRQRTDEEVGVVAPGALLLGCHPVGPRTQQIGSQHQLFRAQELAEGQRLVLQRRALVAIHRRVVDQQVRIVGGTGEQHPALLERLPGRGTHQRRGELRVHAEPLGPPVLVGSVPGDVSGAVPVVDPAARKHHHAGDELHGRMPAHQENLEALTDAVGLVPDQHHRRGGAGHQRIGVGHARLLCAARLRVRRAK